MLVLENLTYRFVRPNVLDIKLGTQLWDGQAREDKRVRMEKVARDTTSGTTGIRLTGFQVRSLYRTVASVDTDQSRKVWDELKSEYVGTDKTYGKSLKPSDLPSGFSRFFFGTHLDRPSPPTTPHQPVPLVRLLLLAILVRLRALEALLPLLEMRMRGGSLLIVVEGDTEALTSAIERAGTTNHLPGPSSRSKLAEGGRQYAREEAEGEEVDQEGKDDDSDDGSDSSSIKTTDSVTDLPLPHTLLPFELRLIDFAHTTDSRIEDGAGAGGGGPDEGVILGVSNVIACLEGLVRSLGVDREEL
jgi:1D-myo-inositol-tetrakisphosphate 5-kinase/inositol-polyphosphate multikinase